MRYLMAQRPSPAVVLGLVGLLVSLAAAPASADVSFAPRTEYSTRDATQPTVTPQSLALVDLDGIHGPDIAIVDSSTRDVDVFLNSGDGTFTGPIRNQINTANCGSGGVNPSSILGGEFDGDAHRDAVVSCAGHAVVMEGDGTGALTAHESAFLGAEFPAPLRVANLDGALALVYVRYPAAGGGLCFLRVSALLAVAPTPHCAQGPPNTPTTLYPDALTPYHPYDGPNGNTDQVLAYAVGSSKTLHDFGVNPFFQQVGAPYFSESDRTADPGAASIAVGDLNGDGIQDIAMGNVTTTTGSISVYLWNTTTGTPTDGIPTNATPATYSSTTPAYDTQIADLDLDGHQDVASIGYTSGGIDTLSIHPGTGDGTLRTPPQTVSLPDFSVGSTQNMVIDDLNGDGKPDIVFLENNVGVTDGAGVLLNATTPPAGSAPTTTAGTPTATAGTPTATAGATTTTAGATAGGGPLGPQIGVFGSPSTNALGATILVRTGLRGICPAGGPACSFSLTARTLVPAIRAVKARRLVIGRSNFVVPAGSSRKLSFKLNAKGARILRKLKRLKVTLTIVARVASGAPVTTTKKITIKAPARTH